MAKTFFPQPWASRPVSIWDGMVAALSSRKFFGKSTEWCIVGASLFFTLFSNGHFWSAWASGRDWSRPGTWILALLMGVLLTAVHSLILGLVITRRSAKPVLGILFMVTAVAVHYMEQYSVYFDASMMRNVFHTDAKEAGELISASMIVALLVYGLVPTVFMAQLTLPRRSLRQACWSRGIFLLGALGISIAGIIFAFQDLSSLMRNQKEVRYLITPANFIMSALRVAAAERNEAIAARLPVGSDARPQNTAYHKPRLLVVVVGETARAANWGLNGYARQTTPQLAAQDGIINFPHVSSCGSNTEVSVPCMFSPFGRKSYDEKKIRQHESVLHVLEHASVKTIWRDNQSGCKGVCDGLETQRPDNIRDPVLCEGEHCLDEILLHGLDTDLQKNPRDMVVVMHQLGNHGPAYSHRYPAAYRRFTPTCEEVDLGKCSREQIVNSYDNALLYTDHFLSKTIQYLQSQQSHDAAMIYLSDHGESLGENGIYLHGLPYAIAPKEQTQVPMVMWLSQEFAATSSVDTACLSARASRPVTQDYLFHSILGLMQVSTSAYDSAYDISAACRL